MYGVWLALTHVGVWLALTHVWSVASSHPCMECGYLTHVWSVASSHYFMEWD